MAISEYNDYVSFVEKYKNSSENPSEDAGAAIPLYKNNYLREKAELDEMIKAMDKPNQGGSGGPMIQERKRKPSKKRKTAKKRKTPKKRKTAKKRKTSKKPGR